MKQNSKNIQTSGAKSINHISGVVKKGSSIARIRVPTILSRITIDLNNIFNDFINSLLLNIITDEI